VLCLVLLAAGQRRGGAGRWHGLQQGRERAGAVAAQIWGSDRGGGADLGTSNNCGTGQGRDDGADSWVAGGGGMWRPSSGVPRWSARRRRERGVGMRRAEEEKEARLPDTRAWERAGKNRPPHYFYDS
jgi:hypothetical protein